MYEPLAERMRPKSLDQYIGQKHLVGPGAVLRKMIESGNISSFILWGPPGVGKTTLAKIIAAQTQVPFYTLSAVTSGVKDVRDILDRCKQDAISVFSKGRPILFIDEIHRFNKSQQDSLLGAVEQGIVTLIGATTENPSFEVIRPLLSRAQVYVLQPLGKDDLLQLLDRAISTDKMFQGREVHIESTEALLRYSGGDARKLLNILDLIMQSLSANEPFVINDDIVTDRLQQNPMAFDKNGEMHYDIISAFIHCATARDSRLRRHRPCQSQRTAAGQCHIRCIDKNRLARGSHHLVGMRNIPRHLAQEQLGIHGHKFGLAIRATNGQPACSAALAQRSHQAHGRARLCQGLQICPRLPGQLRPPRIHAGRKQSPHVLQSGAKSRRVQNQGTHGCPLGTQATRKIALHLHFTTCNAPI